MKKTQECIVKKLLREIAEEVTQYEKSNYVDNLINDLPDCVCQFCPKHKKTSKKNKNN